MNAVIDAVREAGRWKFTVTRNGRTVRSLRTWATRRSAIRKGYKEFKVR